MASSDSAGVPWAGRELKPNPFAGDSGQPEVALLAALEACSQASELNPQRHVDVIEALRESRLFVPIVASLDEAATDASGLTHDKSAEMAMVTLAAEDGRATAPGFTGIEQLIGWNPEARPIPVESLRLMLSAVDEGAQLVVIDPGAPHMFLVRRPAVWSLAQGRQWIPAWANRRVADEIARLAAADSVITATELRPGSARPSAGGAEVGIVVDVPAGTDDAALKTALDRFRRKLAASSLITELVDSLIVSVRTV
ncbi:SseB family protein [Saxibacter everestensis]|uniref:SseB family protein n=1 Tax=Saxibacter everestensis TaxID=2909229 RepID=A0ABY8QVY5_9MICO|nr:SseB family protein [Brevibacteriaceae bacterium ZFBP1038]